MSLGSAIGIDAGVAYGVAVIAALCLPETRGRSLEASTTPVKPPVGGDATARPDDHSPSIDEIHA